MINKHGSHHKSLFKRIAALATSIITIASLSITALAGSWEGNVISFTAQASYGTYPFGLNDINLSWRVDLFVSGREDGTLEPTIDTVQIMGGVNDKANYVGSLLYTQVDFNDSAVYVQDSVSTFSRQIPLSSTYYNGSTGIYNLPYVSEITSASETYGEVNPVYIVKEPAPNGLPSDIDAIGANYSLVEGKVSTYDFTSAVINTLRNRIGDDKLVQQLGRCIDPSILTPYVEELRRTRDIEAFSPLYPDKDGCPVEWAAVVSPMLQFNANSNSTQSMWFINDRNYRSSVPDLFSNDPAPIPTIATPENKGKNKVTLLVDAYGAAQYNFVTRSSYSGKGIYNLPGLHLAMSREDIAIEDQRMIKYQTKGVLKTEYGNLYESLATASVVNEEINPYFSVPCSGHLTDFSYWDDATMARQGGIGIYVTKKDTKEIPVYYYITPDPNNPILPPASATPPTFTPEPPPGTAVKTVAIPYPTADVDPNTPPEDFPPLGVGSNHKRVNPDPDGKYPIDTVTPPKYILVECVPTDIPVYYHVFTFNDTTGTYDDVFEFIKQEHPSEPSAEAIYASTTGLEKPDPGTKDIYTPASDGEALSYGKPVEAISTSTASYNVAYSNVKDAINSSRYNRRLHTVTIPSHRLNPYTSPLEDSDKLEYYGDYAPYGKDATKAIHVKIYALNSETPAPLPEGEFDRIKTFDLTQLIMVNSQATSHIDTFSSYANENLGGYNSQMPAANNGDKTHRAYITNFENAAAPLIYTYFLFAKRSFYGQIKSPRNAGTP